MVKSGTPLSTEVDHKSNIASKTSKLQKVKISVDMSE